ncbi:UNVERIFIED_CONTAM: hypothetical protein GTU68_042200 [Idotea baltica]|nr:hypothetical protein [Idotea baltica]
MALVIALVVSILWGNRIIRSLKSLQIGESVRDLGLDGQKEKTGTPTMGGVIIILAIIIPCLLFSKLESIYIRLLLLSTIWMGMVGAVDDYIKVFKKDKAGLEAKFKILGQIGLGILVGGVMFWHSDIVVRVPYEEAVSKAYPITKVLELEVVAVSNAANLTDGIDGLAAGISAIIATTFAVIAYLSSNSQSQELVIFSASLIGACIGFLWYNSFPAQVFMGDTGSLALGGIIATLAILLRKELLIPIVCGVFVLETVSVTMQVSYFKYTKRKYGEGKRIFRMSPIHHHYQKMGIPEAKIVTRFWIVGILLAILTIITLKVR